jgi:hypothetical protein
MRLVMTAQRHSVYGRVVRAGEEFDVPDNEAVTWLKLGYARKAHPVRATTEAPRAVQASTAEEPKRRGRYSRSDMRVENE